MTWEGLSPPYATIVADPPWRYKTAATKADARKHYSTLSVAELCAMRVGALAADSAHLWLWTTNAMMAEAHGIARSWGFKPMTIVTWCKPGPGVGYYVRNNTEHVLLATRGEPLVPETKPLGSWFVAPRSSHSSKPAAFFDIVEQVSPAPRVELFSRVPHLGWDHWGYGFEGVHTETQTT